MKKRIRLIALLVLATITAVLLWKFVLWGKLSTWYAAFSISDLPPAWYYSTVILLAVLLMVVIWFVLQIVPKRQAQALQTLQKKVVVDGQEIDEDGSIFIPQSSIKTTELFSIENEARKTLSQIIGGFIVIVSLILTGANLAITQGQAEKNRSLALEGQITDRFTNAITQLGDKDKLEVRLGGIYALERIANDSEKDRWTIMEVLTAYIRENAPVKKEISLDPVSSKKEATKKETPATKPPIDIQSIITVIKRRQANGEKFSLDLSQVDLRGAQLGKANIGRAILLGADLRKAFLTGTDLRSAILYNADLRGAYIRETNFSEADLGKADLSGTLIGGAHLNNANLYLANLSRARFYETDFSEADLGKADLRGAELIQVKNLTWSQVLVAIIDDETELPPEIESQHKDELKAMREKTRKERGGK